MRQSLRTATQRVRVPHPFQQHFASSDGSAGLTRAEVEVVEGYLGARPPLHTFASPYAIGETRQPKRQVRQIPKTQLDATTVPPMGPTTIGVLFQFGNGAQPIRMLPMMPQPGPRPSTWRQQTSSTFGDGGIERIGEEVDLQR